jgi:hypothetical protein
MSRTRWHLLAIALLVGAVPLTTRPFADWNTRVSCDGQ